jgi:hypothetical protein
MPTLTLAQAHSLERGQSVRVQVKDTTWVEAIFVCSMPKGEWEDGRAMDEFVGNARFEGSDPIRIFVQQLDVRWWC